MDAPPGDAGSSTRKKRLMTGSVTASESIQTAAHLAFWVLSCAAGRCGSPSPSLHSVQNRCELSVSQQCSCGCGWCRHEPKLMNLLKYVHKEGSQRRGVEQAVVCGSSSWPSSQTLWQVQYTHFPTLLSLWFPSLTFAKTEHWFFPSTLALRSAGPSKTLKLPPWGVQHEQSLPLRSKQMTNSPSKIKVVFFQWKHDFRINSLYAFLGDFWQV